MKEWKVREKPMGRYQIVDEDGFEIIGLLPHLLIATLIVTRHNEEVRGDIGYRRKIMDEGREFQSYPNDTI